jgi:hypothetical protein
MKHKSKKSIKYKTRKYKTRKYKTRKHKTRKYKTRKSRRKYKGGKLTVTPFKMFDYPHGASSESQAALLTGQAKSQAQYEMNKIGGGETMEVPQFFPPGGIKTAYTATNLSADGNLASLIGEVDSTNDHFATNLF